MSEPNNNLIHEYPARKWRYSPNCRYNMKLQILEIKSSNDNKLKVANYLDATSNGIFCYLMDAPHNRYLKNIGHRRIYDLNLQIK